MRPRRPNAYAGRRPQPPSREFQAQPRSYSPSPSSSAYAKDRNGGASRPHALAVVIVVIVVVVIVLVLVWIFAKRGVIQRHTQQARVSSLIPPPQRDPKTGKVLIAQSGPCAQDADCRPGLQCFDTKCRTPETVAIAKQRQAAAAKTRGREQAEIEAAKLKQPPQPSYPAQPEPAERSCADCAVTDPTRGDVMTMQEAKEAGIRATLCHTSAVAEADQDFGY
jgi:hypothetical protein